MFPPPLRCQLFQFGHKQAFPKPFCPQLSDQRQSRGSEQRLLSHGRRVWNVSDSDITVRSVLIAAEDNVGSGIFFKKVWDAVEVGVEVCACGGKGGLRSQSFGLNGSHEAALGGRGDQLVEGILKLSGDGDAGLHDGLLIPLAIACQTFESARQEEPRLPKGARPHIFVSWRSSCFTFPLLLKMVGLTDFDSRGLWVAHTPSR